MKPTVRQKEAMERLTGGKPAAPDLQVSDAAWKRLQQAVSTALAERDMTDGLSIADLQALFAKLQPGINCNGWVNPYPSDDPRSLFKQYQFKSFHDPAQFIMDIWSRQTGKDFTLAGVAAQDAYQSKCDWTLAAPSERQSLESLEKAKDWVMAFQDIVCDFQEEREHPEALIKSAMIILPNRRKIRAVPGMPHTVRGLTSSVGITEADFLDKPKETMRALLGSIANEEAGRKTIRLITTPNGKQGMTNGIWNDPESLYSKRLVTIWHAVCHGLKQNPYVLEKALNDPEGWAQEFLCEWLDGSSVLLPYELIDPCQSFEATERATVEDLVARQLQRIAGVDFGRVTDPTVMVLAERALSMNMVRHIERLRGMSTPDQVRTLMPYLKICDRICVDYTGPGVGFGDLLVQELGRWDPAKHEFGKVELCTFTLPFKREIFPGLRTAFEQRSLKIPYSTWFREDLHAYAQVITNGQYNYKAPRTDDGHSDGCTALALMHRAGLTAAGPAFAQSILRPDRTMEAIRQHAIDLRMGRMNGLC